MAERNHNPVASLPSKEQVDCLLSQFRWAIPVVPAAGHR